MIMFIAFVLFVYALLLLVPAFVFFFRKKEQAVLSPVSFFSVIVPVRNEAATISACLQSLLGQKYPRELFEIIVVNDHSTDETKKLAAEFPGIKILDLPEEVSGKKSALTFGIAQAKGTFIATTDGDCVLPEKWLLHMAAAFADNKTVFACGPVAYKIKNSVLRNFLQIEQVSMQIVAAGAMKMGFPILCSGASLAYRKDFFTQSGGYQNDVFASGDDVLLMLKAQKLFPGKLKFITSEEALVRTEAAASFREAVQQRSRWLSKFSAYRSVPVVLTGIIVFLANFLPLELGLLSLVNQRFLSTFLLAFTVKAGIDLLLLSLAVPFFREPRLLLLVVPGELFYPFLAIVSAAAKLSGSFSWKGRKWS